MPPSKVKPEQTYEAFATEEGFSSVAKRFGISKNTLRTWWTKEFGEEAVKSRNVVKPEDTFSAFQTEEGFHAVAARLKISPNTLRVWWVDKFGKEAFDARGKAIQSKAASKVGSAKKGTKANIQITTEPCEKCQEPVTLNLLQKAMRDQILCTPCSEKEQGVDRHCPVCNLGCVGVKGLSGHMYRPYKGDKEAHARYLAGIKENEWIGKLEPQDYVTCRICQFRGETLAKHLQLHGLTSDEYKNKYPEAHIRSVSLTETRSESLKLSFNNTGKKKTVTCPTCCEAHEVAWSLSSMHNLNCSKCKENKEEQDEIARWLGKTEIHDYVVCQVCGKKDENLVSHVRSVHPELEGHYFETFPGSELIALNSSIRDRNHQIGSKHSEETKVLMSANAGRWNKGLTKITDSRIATIAEKMLGRQSWSKGLTKQDHPGLESTAIKMKTIRASKHWGGYNKVTLTIAELQKYAMPDGKISIGKAMVALSHSFPIIRRECLRLGLEISNSAVKEVICLDTISKILGNAPYKREWNDPKFTNPNTGRRFRFDGYFPDHNLVVEFHGAQHWLLPPNFMIKDEETFRKMQERDRIKENLIHADPILKYFMVREDEPFDDINYLRGKLIDEGILTVCSPPV